MQCQVCKAHPASIHLKEIKDNIVSEVHLCQGCFQQRSDAEASVDTESAALHLATSLDQASAFKSQREAAGRSDISCPECGLAFKEFLEVGRLGCANCYQAFGEELRPFLARIHGGTAHAGKAPQQEAKSLDLRHTLSHLQAELERAIAAEQYERAATLRDRIRDFEREMKSQVRHV